MPLSSQTELACARRNNFAASEFTLQDMYCEKRNCYDVILNLRAVEMPLPNKETLEYFFKIMPCMWSASETYECVGVYMRKYYKRNN